MNTFRALLGFALLSFALGCGGEPVGTPEAEANDPTNPSNIAEQQSGGGDSSGGAGDSSAGGDSSAP